MHSLVLISSRSRLLLAQISQPWWSEVIVSTMVSHSPLSHKIIIIITSHLPRDGKFEVMLCYRSSSMHRCVMMTFSENISDLFCIIIFIFIIVITIIIIVIFVIIITIFITRFVILCFLTHFPRLAFPFSQLSDKRPGHRMKFESQELYFVNNFSATQYHIMHFSVQLNTIQKMLFKSNPGH